jgi:hypothetical protein
MTTGTVRETKDLVFRQSRIKEPGLEIADEVKADEAISRTLFVILEKEEPLLRPGIIKVPIETAGTDGWTNPASEGVIERNALGLQQGQPSLDDTRDNAFEATMQSQCPVKGIPTCQKERGTICETQPSRFPAPLEKEAVSLRSYWEDGSFFALKDRRSMNLFRPNQPWRQKGKSAVIC